MKVSNEMVQRFLGWRLPDDFYPDGGVTFNREVNGGLRPKTWWPVGTNLLTDPQARAMLEHVVGPEFDALLARCEAVEARLALARHALTEIRLRLHAVGRRPEECYEMSLIDDVLAQEPTR